MGAVDLSATNGYGADQDVMVVELTDGGVDQLRGCIGNEVAVMRAAQWSAAKGWVRA